jgi:HemK-related putative methylase
MVATFMAIEPHGPGQRPESVGAAREHGTSRRAVVTLALLLGLAGLVRLPFAPIDFNVTGDMAQMRDWMRSLQERGLVDAYRVGINYPPAHVYVLALGAWVDRAVVKTSQPDRNDAVLNAAIKVPAILADLLTAAIVWVAASRRGRDAAQTRDHWPLAAAAAYAFNPGVWYVSAYWGQTDALYVAALAGTVVLLLGGRHVLAWVVLGLGVSIKLQAVLLVPFAVAVTARSTGVRALTTGVASLVGVLALMGAPWIASGQLLDALRIIPDTGRPRLTVSAYNFWYLIRGGDVHTVSSLITPLGLDITARTLGIVLSLVMLALALRLLRRDGTLALAAAFFSVSVFTFSTEMHERYLFPAIVFTAMAAAATRSLWLPYTVLSANFFFNLVTIAPFTNHLGINLVATSDTSPTTRTLKLLALVVASANVALVLWLWQDGRMTRARPAGAPRFGSVRRLWRLALRVRFAISQRHRHRQLVVEHVTGQPVVVLPDVLNPKLFRTGEFLVEQLAGQQIADDTRVLDMGTGSGVAAVAAARWSRVVTAVDISEAAVRCVRVNALVHRVEDRVEALCGDLFAPVASRTFDLVLFNPPFLPGVPSDEFDRAFRAGDVLERFASALPDHLAPGGRALVVVSSDADISGFHELARTNGLDTQVISRRDLVNEVLYVYRLCVASRGRPA